MSNKYKSVKRYKFLLILAVVLLCSLLATCACAKPESEEPGHKHDYVESVIPATCTQDGLKTFTCECGDSYDQVIKASGHSLKYADNDGGSQHWQECENCDYETEKVAHDYKTVLSSEPSSCTQMGFELRKCECGAMSKQELPLIDHSLKIATNNTQHWQECENCDYETEKVNHSYSIPVSSQPSTCTQKGSELVKCECGATTSRDLPLASHKFTKHTYDSEGHYTVCSVCQTPNPGEEKQKHQYSEKVVTELTCTQDERTKFSCDCGYSYTDVTEKATGHELDKTQFTKRTPSGHFYECGKCGNEVMEQHESIDAECPDGYNRPATCYREGHQDQQCTVCELVYHETTPMTDEHNFSTEWERSGTFHWHPCLNGDGACTAKSDETQHTFVTVREEPTCTEKGTEHKECLCGAVQSGSNRTLPALGHDYEETVLTPATCTQAGEVKKDCRVCGDSVVEPIAQLKHDLSVWDADDVHHWHVCPNCDTVLDYTSGNHNYRIKETVLATCTQDGYKLEECTACAHVKRTTLEAHHNYYSTDEGRVDPTCNKLGTHVEICDVCGDRITVVDEHLGYADHNIFYHEKKEATEDTDGNIAYWECRVCGKYFSSHNCENEYDKDEVIIPAPKTIDVKTIGELQEIALDNFVNEASNDWYRITLTVDAVDISDGVLLLTDENGDVMWVSVNDFNYNLASIYEGDIVTVRGHLIAIEGEITLDGAQILEVIYEDDGLVDLIFKISGDIDYVMLYYTTYIYDEPEYVVSYGQTFNLNNYRYLLVGDELTLTYENYNGTVIKYLVVNGKSYTTVNGQLTIEVTESLCIEIEFSKWNENNVTVEGFDTSWQAEVRVNPYITYKYVNGNNDSGHIVKGSYLRFYVENAYITRIEIQFENYNLTDVAKNTINVGKSEQSKSATSYKLSGTTATLTFSEADGLAFFEYSASASQARIASIKIHYNTYNTVFTWN